MGVRKAALDQAEEILRACGTADHSNVFAANAFAQKDISITAQRRRSLNLAWALAHKQLLTEETVVGVVGCGFSGMCLAVSLSLQTGCIVQLLDKDITLLERFKNASHRFLSTRLNVSARIGSLSGPADDKIPLFRWREGSAVDVAFFWESEFRYYLDMLPIFVHLNREVISIRIGSSREGSAKKITLTASRPLGTKDKRIVAVEILILATGFGGEVNDRGLGKYHDHS